MKTDRLRLGGLAALTLAFSTACGGSKFIVNSNQAMNGTPLGIIGVNPHAPQFANVIAGQLNARGYSAADSRTMGALISALGVGNAFGLQPDPTEDPQTMAALAKNKIDAILSSTEERVAMGTTAGKILRAHIRLTRTGDGSVSEFTWENAWGGMPGSPADSTMRKDDDSAAQTLVEELAPLLGSPGPKQSVDLVGLARSAPRAPARAQPREERTQDSEPAAASPSTAKPWWKDDGAAAADDAPAPAKTAPTSPKASSVSDSQLTP